MTHCTHLAAKIATGLNLEVLRQGPAQATPLVLLHGFTDSCRSFGPLLEELPSDIHAIAVSLRGHGGSDRPAGPYDLATMAGDVAALLEHLGHARAIIAGHCMGGFVAQRFALDFPDRTAGLVLIDSFPTMRGNDAVEELAADIAAFPDGDVDPQFVRAFQESASGRLVPAQFLDMIVAESRRLPAQTWRAVLSAILTDDLTRQLPRVIAPALLVWGDRDALFGRRCQDELLAALPQARLEVLPGLGHAPHWEDPETVARIIADFVRVCLRETPVLAHLE